MLPNTLSMQEYTAVLHALSATFMCNGCALMFIILTQKLIRRSYRLSMVLCATLLLAATYHSYELMQNWKEAYTLSNDLYLVTGQLFSETAHYLDRLFTLPLILAAFVCLFQETKQLHTLLLRLMCASVFMLSLGYASEYCSDPANQVVNMIGANLFLFYIIYVLWFELKPIVKRELQTIIPYLKLTRGCLILSWPLYSAIYLAKNFMTIHGTTLQFGYCFINLIARIVPVLLCFLIAYMQSQRRKLIPSQRDENTTRTLQHPQELS